MEDDRLKNEYEEQIRYNNNYSIVVSQKPKGKAKKNIAKLMAVTLGIGIFGFTAGVGSEFARYTFNDRGYSGSGYTANDNGFKLLSTSTSNNRFYGSTREVVEDVEKSVVSIVVESENYRYYSSNPKTYESSGSGIIIKEDDDKIYIATNNHVIEGATKVYISVDDFNKVAATYVGSDPAVDLAVISVSKSSLAQLAIDYKVARLGTEEDLAVGEVAIAMGNALGLGKTATQGIISAIDKTIEIEGSTLQVIQTDAAINPGNSGGALVNSKGLVIGINTAKLSSSVAEGVGYSIPITVAAPILDDLILNGSVSKPYIGIEGFGITQEILERYSLPSYGIYINGVANNSGASKGGIRQGDIITEYNGVVVETMDDLGILIDNSQVGDTVILKIIRGNRVGEIEVVLGNLTGESF